MTLGPFSNSFLFPTKYLVHFRCLISICLLTFAYCSDTRDITGSIEIEHENVLMRKRNSTCTQPFYDYNSNTKDIYSVALIFVVVFLHLVSIRMRQDFSLSFLLQCHLLWSPDFYITQKKGQMILSLSLFWETGDKS